MTIKYIDDTPEKGISYDYKLIAKEYEKLKCPKDVYNPIPSFLSGGRWHIALSERSTGKTTNIILLGMVMNKLYGTVIHYVRQVEEMTAPKILGEMMSVINEYGYVQKLTNGKYNHVTYKNRRFTYVLLDNGNEIEKSPTHFMYAMSLDKDLEYKSGYNSPRGDFIIYDEFVTPDNRYKPNEFVTLCDIIKTVFRDRECGHIFLLANTVNKHSTYFHELGISKEILTMNVGDSRMFETSKNTKIYIELIGNKITQRRKKVNELFFGFDNQLLASITGGEWAIYNYPHIEHDVSRETLQRHIYIEFNSNYVEFELCHSDEIGLHVCAHMSTRKPRELDESLYYTFKDEHQRFNYHYCFGTTKFDKLIWSLYEKNKFQYSDNEVGEIVRAYVSESKLRRKYA